MHQLTAKVKSPIASCALSFESVQNIPLCDQSNGRYSQAQYIDNIYNIYNTIQYNIEDYF